VRYVSTRGGDAVDFRTALFAGLAPDGGLYLPEAIPVLPPAKLDALEGASLADVGAAIAPLFVPDIPAADLESLCRDAFDFPTPMVDLGDGVHVLELFHGPTLAFKDVGARFMARAMGWYLGDSDASLTILVATSGDTGGAVAQAFHGVPRTEVVVLYPAGKVSPAQEAQFATLDGNVRAYAVDGVFDDCQRMVKEAFADEALRRELHLTSANSINVGRLVPQTFYYFLASRIRGAAGSPPRICTPSGNFGNLCAGVLAKRLGLRCAGFVAATNANDVVPEYARTGIFAPRPSVSTISSAMDVGAPSNFDRIRVLYGDSVDAFRADVTPVAHDDAATRDEIARVYRERGYLLDPHTAVGLLGLRAVLSPGEAGVVLATAHPAKFREEVEPVIGEAIPLPDALADGLARKNRAGKLPPETGALKRVLRGG
jgi:threonine synthase